MAANNWLILYWWPSFRRPPVYSRPGDPIEPKIWGGVKAAGVLAPPLSLDPPTDDLAGQRIG
jgi:hypothetical protein